MEECHYPSLLVIINPGVKVRGYGRVLRTLKRFSGGTQYLQERGAAVSWKESMDWRKKSNCTSQIPGVTEDHTSALSIYHYVDEPFLKELNKAMETMMVNVTTYEKDFHFKALHFLLMDSMTLLKPKECREVYVILEDGEKVPKINSTVKFASFTKVESDLRSIDVDGLTILKIKTCFYINLGDQLCLKNLGKILLSPAEVFTVERIDKKTVEDEKYTEVVLSHRDLQSNHNCVMFSRCKSISNPSKSKETVESVNP
uniref:NAD(P)(+)--arginine ADP-ribosyltransferase n=1 Tax=Poecilia mexicana TaxID=48701 RepID=A0A3B3XLY4_9TELE